jgi:leader peptidase (prepilin peptidase)/N-methyltransferase
MLRGRCRRCGARISARYPLIELATAAVFLAAALAFADVVVAAIMALFLSILLALALVDVESRVIPNAVVYPSLGLFGAALVVAAATSRHVDLLRAVLGLLIFGGGLLLVALARAGGMGMGDVKLAGLIGLVLGSQGLQYVAVAAGLAILIGGVAAVGVLAARRSMKSTMPFGPYLVAGAFGAAIWGGPLARAYLSLLR